ncbi:Nif3-like dinuclear metal center hexameric protein [Pseudidiomarina taiwanensis]|uniref:GTP cyclohydrolase 1 type 2 homolog n=1 Tax=Pseudidiomarina taiwanensis TaxID=337250 RepID=A0A432ZMZ2_9GAMM|nr:Nif3-like dinuclear metal center hexameric protein [Pseudidiomarina taiwanensis]RUO79259.1 Nif3-like dinuclear metal center hexameric protein [Pseudidiomarina taiwanensis]
MQRQQLEQYLADYLATSQISDYSPNGLQVEGRTDIKRIVTGVTASQRLLDAAVQAQADAILVHHGYFWKNEPAVITGMKKQRIATLLQHDINLFGYHLPIDVHPEVGNNAQLGRLLGFTECQAVESIAPTGVVMQGQFDTPVSLAALVNILEQQLQRSMVCVEAVHDNICTVAWCTGGGQGFIDAAAAAGADLFITGEVSEQTIHSARELGINFIAAGHHATERYGIRALGEHLAERFGLEHQFIDIDNPA